MNHINCIHIAIQEEDRVKLSFVWPEFSDRLLGGGIREILPDKFYGAH